MKFIKVTGVQQDYFWYKDRIGTILPVLWESDKAFTVDMEHNTERQQAIVLREDCEPVENAYCYFLTVESVHADTDMVTQLFAYREKSLLSPSGMKQYLDELKQQFETERVLITQLLPFTPENKRESMGTH